MSTHGNERAKGLNNPLLDILDHTAIARRDADGLASFVAESRHELIGHFAWAIPSDEAVSALVDVARGRGILEIGAGTGYWASLLTQAGADVRATDVAPPARHLGPGHNSWHPDVDAWFDVEPVDGVAAAAAETARVLFMCWPPALSTMATDAVRAYRGEVLAYVGEWFGATTGDSELPEVLESEWELVELVRLPVWHGRSDQLRIFHRGH